MGIQFKMKPRCFSRIHVKKPGIELRVAGGDNGEVSFDNLREWELK